MSEHMDMNVLKQKIEEQTGVPAELLTAETAVEIIHQARELLNWKPGDPPKATRDQFAQYFAESMGYEPPVETAQTALDAISEAYEAESRLYPDTHDGGEFGELPDGRSAKEKFCEWIGENYTAGGAW